MDPIAMYIVNSHGLLGHDLAAALIGQPPGNRADCLLCQFETAPTPECKQAVIDAIGEKAV